jgi:SAM-dependent methyltransferase
MNRAHRCLCASRYWQRTVHNTLAPWVLDSLPPAIHAVELGPGPGATTVELLALTETLSCVEIDPARARALATRFGDRVDVRCEDAAAMSLASGSCDLAVAVAMLHHVPAADVQDRILREVARVLRPGGVLAGYEITSNAVTRVLHWFDTMTTIDPRACAGRLVAAGFVDVAVDVRRGGYRFRAAKRA